MMFNAYTTALALLTAVVGTCVGLLTANTEAVTAYVGEPQSIAFFSLATLIGLPIMFAMPRLRASFFGGLLRLPVETYLLPRWCVRSIVGMGVGTVVASVVLAVVVDAHVGWMAAGSALGLATFCTGAWCRMSQHPTTEFALPCTIRWWIRRWGSHD